MQWQRETQEDRISEQTAVSLGVLEMPLVRLGLPASGTMFIVRRPGAEPLRLVFDASPAESTSRP
jgi:hypothetical protein